jgi:hypothetical protein
MIEIPEQSDLDDLKKQISAIKDHLRIKFLAQVTTWGWRYIAVEEDKYAKMTPLPCEVKLNREVGQPE